MSDNEFTRRTLLRTCAGASGFVTLGSLAGCTGSDGNGGDTTDADDDNETETGTSTPDGTATPGEKTPGETTSGETTTAEPTTPGAGGSVDVPAASQAIVQLNVKQMINDQNIRDVVNKFLSEAAKQGSYTGPTTVEEALTVGETMGGLESDGLTSITMFTKVEGSTAVESYTGIMMQTDWTANDLISTIESQGGTDLTKGSYQGVTTYSAQGEQGLFAVLGDGTFVAGTETAVKDAIDISTGNAEPLSGKLATYFSNTSAGHLRFASKVPEDQIPSDTGQLNIEGLQELRYLSGSFFSQSNKLGIKINMHTTGSTSASDLSENLGALLEAASMSDQLSETEKEIINNVEFSASGSTATMTYIESVSKINSYVETYASQLFGASMGTSASFVEPAAAA